MGAVHQTYYQFYNTKNKDFRTHYLLEHWTYFIRAIRTTAHNGMYEVPVAGQSISKDEQIFNEVQTSFDPIIRTIAAASM